MPIDITFDQTFHYWRELLNREFLKKTPVNPTESVAMQTAIVHAVVGVIFNAPFHPKPDKTLENFISLLRHSAEDYKKAQEERKNASS